MRMPSWTVLAVAVLVLGVSKSRAEEVVGTTNADTAVHLDSGAAGEAHDVPGPGAGCEGGPSCCQRIWQWLTYHPLCRCGCCSCCKPCEPCGMPPLYIFFLCDRWGYHGCGVHAVPPGSVVSEPQNTAPQNAASQNAANQQ
jgi:hypothetical protein